MKTPIRVRIAWLCLTFALALGLPLLSGQAVPQGSIRGAVTDGVTGTQLEGAEVSIPALGVRALTGRDGSFTLLNVPPGKHIVRFQYTGLEPQTTTVEVRSGEAATSRVILGESTQQLDAFVVSSTRHGEAASITKQRNALNVVNVVAIDTFGDVADGNIGNFMVRLPGVAAEETSNGDIIGIKIRGTPAELSAVNLDGVRVSNAVSGFSPMGDRATMIDHLPAEFIKEIEVHKALIPSMPADSIGGSTNLVTKSALDFSEPVFTYKVGAAYNTYRDSLRNFTPTSTLTYMTKVGRERPIGVTLSLSYNVTEMPRDRVQVTRPDPDGRLGQARTLAEINTRERVGTGLKLDYRLSDSFTVALKFNYAFYHYEGMREIAAATAIANRAVADYSVVSRAQIEAGTPPRTAGNAAAAGVAPGFSDAYTELLNATWTNEMGRVVRYARNYLGEFSGEKKFSGGQKLKFQASYNPSWFDADLPTLVTTLTNGSNTTAAGIGMIIDARQNRSRPRFIQSYGPSVAAGSDVGLYTGVYSTGRGRTEEEISNLQADYTKSFPSRELPVELKVGVNWRQQHRWLFTTSKSWRVLGPDGVAMRNPATGQNDDLRPFLEVQPGYGLFNNQYTPRNKYDILAVERASVSNQGWFQPTAAFAPPSYREATEDVTAAYLQGNVRWGRFTLLGGVRMEKTDIEAMGSLSDPRRPAVGSVTREGGYRDYFPSAHLSYEVRRNLIARLSYSTGFSRPGLSSLYPVTTVVYDSSGSDGRVTQNDPGLKPQQSKNYDASLEWYYEPAGLLSFGVFRKDITDFIASDIREIPVGPNNGFDGLYGGFEHVTTSNGGKAKIEGFEANFMQQLVWLPAPFNHLRVFANLTDLKTSGQYASGAAELAKFVPRTSNVGLSYQYRALGFRIAQRYTSAFLDGYNANVWSRTRFRPDRKVDLSFSYQVRRQLTVYVDVLNVFNKWPDQYTGPDSSDVTFSNIYGTKINFGLNGRF